MLIKIDLFLQVQKYSELIINNMLTNVTKLLKIRQFCEFTCFIIYVDSDCVGEQAYA